MELTLLCECLKGTLLFYSNALYFSGSVTTSLAFLFAVGTHSLLDGFVIASQESVHSTWLLALALSAHKWIVALSVGSTLEQKGVTVREFH